MAKIIFATGEVYEGEAVSVYEAAKAVYGSVSREVLCALVNGEAKELSTLIEGEAEVKLVTFKDKEGKEVFRHTAAHIMAQAVKRLYPNTKQTIGPATDTGYFQDFDAEISFTPDILKNIEGEMKKIVKENLIIERKVISRAEAIELFRSLDEPYKVERIEELPEDAEISIYTQGEYTDLCAGPHLHSTGAVKAFLSKILIFPFLVISCSFSYRNFPIPLTDTISPSFSRKLLLVIKLPFTNTRPLEIIDIN